MCWPFELRRPVGMTSGVWPMRTLRWKLNVLNDILRMFLLKPVAVWWLVGTFVVSAPGQISFAVICQIKFSFKTELNSPWAQKLAPLVAVAAVEHEQGYSRVAWDADSNVSLEFFRFIRFRRRTSITLACVGREATLSSQWCWWSASSGGGADLKVCIIINFKKLHALSPARAFVEHTLEHARYHLFDLLHLLVDSRLEIDQ